MPRLASPPLASPLPPPSTRTFRRYLTSLICYLTVLIVNLAAIAVALLFFLKAGVIKGDDLEALSGDTIDVSRGAKKKRGEMAQTMSEETTTQARLHAFVDIYFFLPLPPPLPSPPLPAQVPSRFDPAKRDRELLEYTGYVFAVFAGLLLLFTIFMFSRIRLAIAVMKVAAQALGKNISLLLYPVRRWRGELPLARRCIESTD